MINVSRQGNNVKIKYNLKINLQSFHSCLVLSKHIITLWNKLYEVFCKNSQRLNPGNFFFKKLHLRCFTGFWIHLRRSRSQMSFKTDFFKNFAIFTGKHLRWILFVMMLPAYKPANLLKRDSNTSIVLLIFINF